MSKDIDARWLRLIDANSNRLKEGLRVCEDVARFIHDDSVVTRCIKDLRHEITAVMNPDFLQDIVRSRDITGDVGKRDTVREMERSDASDVFYANAQRVKESLRVLEEFMKLVDQDKASSLKRIRYQFYDIEKKIISGW